MLKEQDILKKESTHVHQLRSPLTSIRWCSEMLLSGKFGKLDKCQTDLIQEIHSATIRLNNIINILPNTMYVEDNKKPKE